MAASHALIPWSPDANKVIGKIDENSRQDKGKWALVLNALLSPSPGRTLDRVYTSLGEVLEKQANRAAYKLGLGPHVVAQKIKAYFGSDDERVQRLEDLRTSTQPKLEKRCLKLMKYTLRTESTNVQRQAFKDVVELVTLFPGLRVLFLSTKCLDGSTSIEAISALWDRSTGSPDEDWTFWEILAATCLTETTISAILERSSVTDSFNCQAEDLSVIERLVIERESSGASAYSSALCLRYLGGILDLPGFWSEEGYVHAHIANKLCGEMVVLLKDIGVDILTLSPIDEGERPFDYEGVDFLVTIILNGLLSWVGKLDRDDRARQPWYDSFGQLVQLLRRPRAAELLPQSSSCAITLFEDIIPTSYKVVKLNVIVDSENETRDTPHSDAPLTDLNYKNDSTSRVNSTISDQDDRQSQVVNHEDHSETRSLSSTMTSLEASQNISSVSNDESYDSDAQLDDIQDVGDSESGRDLGQGSNSNRDPGQAISGMHDIALVEGSAHSTPYPSLKNRREGAEQLKLILVQRRRDLGDNHPETIVAMENLALAHYKLGEYRLARDLRVVALEKRRIVSGEDHPDTLRIVGALGSTYHELGQFEEAESLKLEVLEKRKKVLGPDHPRTLWAMGNFASTHGRLGRLAEAENLLIQVLEKQRRVLGEDHSDTFRTMGNLAVIYEQLGRLTDVESLVVQVLEKQRKTLGEDHPSTLATMSNLAATYHRLGQFKKGEELGVVVLEKQTRILGDDHSDTLWTMSCLASTYGQLGQFQKAEELGFVVLEKQRRLLGEDHRHTLYTIGNLSWISDQQLERAEKLYVTAMEKRKKIAGDDNPGTKLAMHNLASKYVS